MRLGRRLLAVVLLVALGSGGALLLRHAGLKRNPVLGPLQVRPASERLSIRVGERVQFSAAADGATQVVWSLWGRRVLTSPSFTFAPGPRDAGWQQVAVEVWGPEGTRVTHAWDVGVVPAVAPELVELTPAPGAVRVTSGEAVRFRGAARVPAARASDRVHFEWTLDGQPLRRDDHPAEAAVSEIALPAPSAGTHRVALRVSEDDKVTATAEWTLDVAPAATERQVALAPVPRPAAAPAPPAAAPAPPAVAPPPAATPSPPPEPAPPRMVRAPGPRRLETQPGARLDLMAGVTPAEAPVSYAWTVDGRAVRGGQPRLRWEAKEPGTHRIAVRVSAGTRTLGADEWTVLVRAPTPPPPVPQVATPAPPPAAPPAPPTAAPPAPPTALAPRAAPAGLDEAQVRRWIEDYARAWSRKDTAALQRMGQIRSTAEAERVQRYFDSIDELRVDVRVRSVRVEGERAAVEFDRVDTVTDPSGRRQELTLPPMRKEIERTPDGLRFVARGGAG